MIGNECPRWFSLAEPAKRESLPKRWWASTLHERPTSQNLTQRVHTVVNCFSRRAQRDEAVTISLIWRMALCRSPFHSLSCGSTWLFVTLRGSPCLSVALHDALWLSLALRDTQWPSRASPWLCDLSVSLFDSPSFSMSLCGSLWPSVALCGSPCFSVALRASPCVSVTLCPPP